MVRIWIERIITLMYRKNRCHFFRNDHTCPHLLSTLFHHKQLNLHLNTQVSHHHYCFFPFIIKPSIACTYNYVFKQNKNEKFNVYEIFLYVYVINTILIMYPLFRIITLCFV